jgi:hypothetical protein
LYPCQKITDHTVNVADMVLSYLLQRRKRRIKSSTVLIKIANAGTFAPTDNAACRRSPK